MEKRGGGRSRSILRTGKTDCRYRKEHHALGHGFSSRVIILLETAWEVRSEGPHQNSLPGEGHGIPPIKGSVPFHCIGQLLHQTISFRLVIKKESFENIVV